MKVFLASTWFQLCWFAAVLGTYQWQWVTLFLTLATLLYCLKTDASSLKSIGVIVTSGLVLDTLNQQLSVFVFPTPWL
ncbi:DUF2878 family protein, partial [Vibrio parahaemolyticus]|nr:DUF2878 family protein [Vibrio parahaemolyticus]